MMGHMSQNVLVHNAHENLDVRCPHCRAVMKAERAAKCRTDMIGGVALQWCIECNHTFMIDGNGAVRDMPEAPSIHRRNDELSYELDAHLISEFLIQRQQKSEYFK
jgi:hypothetical protein